MNTALDKARPLPLSLAWAAVYLAALAFFDFPKPHTDDLFYVGAALNMAGGGDFSNPLIARQGYPSHYFFVYPPLETYALWGWLKLFGVHARSMTGFVAACNFLTAASTIAVLRKRQAPTLLEWLVPMGVSCTLLPCGLRPEPLAVALIASGFAVIECAKPGAVAAFLGFLLMALGASAAPRVVVFTAALMLLAAQRLLGTCSRLDRAEPEKETPGQDASVAASSVLPSKRAGGSRLAVTFAAAGFGMAGAVAVFLFMIQLRPLEFWHTFHQHSARASYYHKFANLVEFFNESPAFSNAHLPLALILLGLLIFAWPRQPGRLRCATVLLLAAIPFEALLGVLGFGGVWFLVLALLFISAAILQERNEASFKLCVVLTFAFCLANVEPAIHIYGRAAGHIVCDPGSDASAAVEIRPAPGRAVFIDSTVARYLFDYNIPTGMFDFRFGAPFPAKSAFSDMHPGDVYLLGPDMVNHLKYYTLLDRAVPEWAPFGLANRHFFGRPCQVFIIPAEDCHGLRAEAKGKQA